MYVIRNINTNQYVAIFGLEHSYTTKMHRMQTFTTREAALKHCCSNEIVLKIDNLFPPPRGDHE